MSVPNRWAFLPLLVVRSHQRSSQQVAGLVSVGVMSSPHDDNDTSNQGEQVALDQVREARQFHQLLSGAEEVARGDLWEIVEALTRQVDELRGAQVTAGSGSRQMESDMRWLDARVVLLEQALSDSRGEVATLRDYIDAYAAEMRLDIQDASANARSERQLLIDELRDLAASNAELETVLAQLRSESSDRIEGVAAELFEVADRTRHIAAEAHITASAAAERSQGLLDEIQDNVERVQALAEQAQSADDLRGIAEDAQAVAQRSTDAVDEVRSIAEQAQVVAQRSTDAVDDIRVIAEEAQAVAVSSAAVAEESKKSSSEVREIAKDAHEAAKVSMEATEGVFAIAEESKKSSSEVRALAEEAQAVAASSAVIAEDAHQAAKVSIEATEGVFAIAEEARTTASTNTKAVQEAREVAQGAHDAVAETKEATEEIRVMTEKAKDLAERSADDVAAMQADVDARGELSDVNVTELSKEISRLKADVETASDELRSGWEQVSSDVDSRVEAATTEVSQRLRAEVDASTEAMQQELRDEASSLRNETNALSAKVDDYAVGVPVAAPTEDINDLRNQLMELRHRMESLASSSDRRSSSIATPPEQPRNTKRWVAHLDLTTVTPEPDLPALPAGSDDDEQARS